MYANAERLCSLIAKRSEDVLSAIFKLFNVNYWCIVLQFISCTSNILNTINSKKIEFQFSLNTEKQINVS